MVASFQCMSEYDDLLLQVLSLLHHALESGKGADGQTQGTMMLELHSLEIQMHSETGHNRLVKVRLRFLAYFRIPTMQQCV